MTVLNRRISWMQSASLWALLFAWSALSNAEILFEDDFENGMNNSVNGSAGWTSSVRTSVSSVQTKSGNSSLEFIYPVSPSGDAFSEQRYVLGGAYTEIWASYDIYIPLNYVHENLASSNNNKGYLYVWSGSSYSSPNGPGMGPNFWPNPDGSSKASHYTWAPGMDRHYWGAMPEAIKLSDRGQWIKIIAHYKYASAANNDGVAEMWKQYSNGTLTKVMDIQNGAWYVEGQSGFTHGYILGWANSGFRSETRFYIDNVTFSTTPLLDQNALFPPSPPGQFQVVYNPQ